MSEQLSSSDESTTTNPCTSLDGREKCPDHTLCLHAMFNDRQRECSRPDRRIAKEEATK